MASTSTAQARIQLSTRNPDIDLPEDTGPILVSTGKKIPVRLCAAAKMPTTM